MSTTRKRLELTITLGTGTFGEDVGDTVTLSGFRMTADAMAPGGDSMGRCMIRVFGLKFDVMNKLTTIGTINTAIKAKSSVSLAAGDDVDGLSSIFSGTILDAWADYNASPDVAFNIVAYSGLTAAVKPVDATSYKGSVDVATVLSDIAQNEMGLQFENHGVSVQLSNPYLSGTALTKVRQATNAAAVLWAIEMGTLIIWPTNDSRPGDVPLISPATGMVGYPTLSSKGMSVKMIFNPKIKIGTDIEVSSSIPMACGKWRVYSLDHSLSSELDGGPWFTNAEVYNGGQ